MSTEALITDADRYPGLSLEGAQLLHFMREHPHAPIYRNQSGHRLTAADVAYVREFEQAIRRAPIDGSPNAVPAWVAPFIADCRAHVPFYRRYPGTSTALLDQPLSDRGDLSQDIAAFVPDHVPVERLINYRTSGTTGHPLLLASHPRVAGCYLAFHLRALRRFGIELRHGRGQVGVVLVGYQQTCFTYVSVTPLRDESGLAKLNLHPTDWRHPADRAKYLDALNPEVYTGDPLSLSELMALPLTTRPRALLSTSMALTPALRAQFESHFGCPVLDLYSMNEAGPIAVGDPRVGGHVLLQPRLYIEILDAHGQPVPAGIRGEVTLTGGFNFCLPLLRYRTGDHAALAMVEGEPVLIGLEGRPPVRFLTTNGEWKNNIEVTHVLRRFALAQWVLHQRADRSFHFRCSPSGADGPGIRRVLLDLLGADATLTVEVIDRFDDKVIQYTSELKP